MKVEFNISKAEARVLQGLLQSRYKSKTELPTLARKALREAGGMQARSILFNYQTLIDEHNKKVRER